MLMCLSDVKQQIASLELNKKLTRNQKLQTAYANEKLDTMLSQVNASQNWWQTIGNTHNGFSPWTSIIT